MGWEVESRESRTSGRGKEGRCLGSALPPPPALYKKVLSFSFLSLQEIVITTDPSAQPSSSVFPINYPSFPALVEPGQVLQVRMHVGGGEELGRSRERVESLAASVGGTRLWVEPVCGCCR